MVWCGVFFALEKAGSLYSVLDNTVSLLGFSCTFLALLAYIEYAPIWLIGSFMTIILNVQLVMNDPSQLSYLVYSVYCAYCTVVAYINVMRLYKEQNT